MKSSEIKLLQSLISQFNLTRYIGLVASSDLAIMEVAETACYLGAALSALIAQRIVVMPDKTFINKMFLWYFAVDAIMGTLNTFLLFHVQRFGNNQLGHREFRSESYCLLLPKYENYGLFNPTGGSPDVVHLII